jgi:3-deoxy-manno-octulosonate cytidylyltransferase (CMP-KDO synthetase)
MNVIACIPARLQSTRLPNKLLLPLGNQSILATTYEAARNTHLFSKVIAICDKEILADEIAAINGDFLLSKKEHETGTDRIAEFLPQYNADIIINIQADEPFINKNILEELIKAFNDERVQVASCMYRLQNEEDILNPNHVKVVCDKNNFAQLFSRAPIPYQRNASIEVPVYKHVGIYAFRPSALRQFCESPAPLIEQAEQLENLRFIYYNIPVKMVVVEEMPISIDTQSDYEKALAKMEAL